MTRTQSPMPQDDEDEDDMYSYFNKSITAVQARADQFEQAYARPALETSQTFFDERPISATFIVIFSLLSFLPVASFVGLSLFAVASFTIIAVSCAFLASATVVLTLLSLLVLTLVTTFVSSLLLTLFGISFYSFTRLVSLLRSHGRAGVSVWIAEMQHSLISTLPIQLYSPRSEDAELTDTEDILGGLAIEVKHEDTDPPFTPDTRESLFNEEELKEEETGF